MVQRTLLAALTPFPHITYLQEHCVLIPLSSVCPDLTNEERNVFLLQDLGLNVTNVTGFFMVSSTQLLRVVVATAEPCLAALAKLQLSVP
jgi:hypothetical protein